MTIIHVTHVPGQSSYVVLDYDGRTLFGPSTYLECVDWIDAQT